MSAFNKLIEIFCFKLFSKKYIRNYLSPWRLYLLEHLTCHSRLHCLRWSGPIFTALDVHGEDYLGSSTYPAFFPFFRETYDFLWFFSKQRCMPYTRNKHKQLMYITHKKTLNKINVIVFIYHKLYSYIFMHDAELTGKTIIGSSSTPFLPGTIKAGW